MRIITCASYFGTGSSAVTDFITEFDNVLSLGKYEYRFIQDPDGISDLEYNIVENNHRHNTSNAIKRYRKMTSNFKSFGYAGGYNIFDKKFETYTEMYINEITELKTKNWWYMDRIYKGELFCYIDRIYSFIKRLMTGGLHTEKRYSLMTGREESYFSAIDESTFLAATRKYIDNLFSCINHDNYPFIMVDQLVPSTNTNRYIRYFNDIKVIVVERDPRDIYLYEKTRFKWGVIPTDRIEDYVKWFKITRKYSHPKDEDVTKVFRLQFEDLVYNYEITARKLIQFLELDEKNHNYVKEKFNPEISIRNTNLKKVVLGYEKEIEYIEKNLSEYLYDYEKKYVGGNA